MNRPISVWIAQILFVFFVLMIILGFVIAMMTTQPSERSFGGFLFTATVSVIFIVLFVAAFWAMAVRKAYGRWFGVGLLSFMVIFANLSKVLFPSDSDQSMVSIVIRVLYSVFLVIVILHISLSDKMEAFFTAKADPSRIDHPPPPPSFD
ncbi:MAG: hypothetical protein KA956_14470 [Pyrinomonadaceae bacterium]|nr:hypothetical protein [Pyrinomonadaceae bacterium]